MDDVNDVVGAARQPSANGSFPSYMRTYIDSIWHCCISDLPRHTKDSSQTISSNIDDTIILGHRCSSRLQSRYVYELTTTATVSSYSLRTVVYSVRCLLRTLCAACSVCAVCAA
eukprot:COSAG06_NODE_31149_length_526_cov_0.962529_1_plen_113_part_01